MEKSWERCNLMLSIFSGGLLSLAMVVVIVEIIARLFFNSPIIGVTDFVTLLVPIFIFLPMAHAESHDRHLRVEIFTSRMSPRWQAVFDLMAAAIGVVLIGLMAWKCWGWAASSWQAAEYLPGLVRIRAWPGKFAIAIGATLFAVQLGINGVRAAGKLRSSSD